jgi:predicted GTPase
MARTKVLILGAAGRDFHNFNLVYRDREDFEVVGFTATQIPNIDGRRYPPKLAGKLYPDGIPIHPEGDLEKLIADLGVDEAVFAYSDVSHAQVMHLAARAVGAGADFRLLGMKETALRSSKPSVSICAVRTGCGKSQTTRRVSDILKGWGRKLAVIRHPMPYGDLEKQAVQRFATYEDLDRHDCTIEEREEYEPHLDRGSVVFAGVDYGAILKQAEQEADVSLWDGGNNDIPFIAADIEIVIADPLRPGHEEQYWPGEANFRRAHCIVINKISDAPPAGVDQVRNNARRLNPSATVVEADSPITTEDPKAIAGKKVLIVEDGPTLTHGGMSFGAGHVAAKKFGAGEIIDPRPFAVGSIAAAYEKYPTMGKILPALGYGDEQQRELKTTIEASGCELVLIATPIDLRRVLSLEVPSVRVIYELKERGKPDLPAVLERFRS